MAEALGPNVRWQKLLGPPSDVILSPYDLTALVYVLLLGLRLTISRLVSMHFVVCRFLRILEDMSFLSFLRILNLLEEPPHLTADFAWGKL